MLRFLGFLGLFFGTLVRLFCSHQTLLLENLALRQQLVVLLSAEFCAPTSESIESKTDN